MITSPKVLILTLSQQYTTGKLDQALATLLLYWKARVEGADEVMIGKVSSDEVAKGYGERIAESIKAKLRV